jgi:hypothetical protein
VEDQLAVADGTGHRGGAGDAALDEFNAIRDGVQVVVLAGAEVVQHADAVARRQQSLHQVRADKPRAAGDQAFWHNHPPRIWTAPTSVL